MANRKTKTRKTKTSRRTREASNSAVPVKNKKTVTAVVIDKIVPRLEFEPELEPEQEVEDAQTGTPTGPTITNSKGKEISDDIEKDINIDVHINNNTSCRIQHISRITINYYNNNDQLQRTNLKNRT